MGGLVDIHHRVVGDVGLPNGGGTSHHTATSWQLVDWGCLLRMRQGGNGSYGHRRQNAAHDGACAAARSCALTRAACGFWGDVPALGGVRPDVTKVAIEAAVVFHFYSFVQNAMLVLTQ